MSEDGSISQSTAILVMRAYNVGGSRNSEEASISVLSKGDVVVEVRLWEKVERKTLHLLSRMVDIPIHHFYHPQELPTMPGERVH